MTEWRSVFNIEFGTAFFSSFLVLFVMSFLSLAFSVFFHSRLRTLRKLPSGLSVSVFDKTFNVFNPYPSRGKIVHTFLSLLPIFTFVGSLSVFYVVARIFQAGLVLGLVFFIVCLGLMIFDEAVEVSENADIFTKAIRKGASFGRGDLTVFYVLKGAMRRLRIYYFSLAVVFLILSVTVPYVLSSLLLAFAQFGGLMFELSAFAESFAFVVCVFLFAGVTTVAFFVVRRIKSKVVGLPSPEYVASVWRVTVKDIYHDPRMSKPESEEVPEDQREKF